MLLTSAFILAIALYYYYVVRVDQKIKNDLKQAAMPCSESQDTHFCLIASAISKSRTQQQLHHCMNAIVEFDKRYTDKSGRADTGELLKFYVLRQEKIGVAI